jgi:hypothetical protein
VLCETQSFLFSASHHEEHEDHEGKRAPWVLIFFAFAINAFVRLRKIKGRRGEYPGGLSMALFADRITQ